MISDGSAVLSAGGRDWSFKLTIGQWMKLQQHFGGGPEKVSERIFSDQRRIEDVREVIERGLEGGGLDANSAREKATEIMDSQPLTANYKLAFDVLGAANHGLEEYLKKKSRHRNDGDRPITNRDGQWDFVGLLGLGNLAGIQPTNAKQLSIGEFFGIIDVWIEAHDSGRSKGGNLTTDEKDEIWDWMQSRQSPLTLKEAREKANGHGSG